MNKSFRIFIGYTIQKYNIILSYLQKNRKEKTADFRKKFENFCKKFSPKNQKETSVGQILSVLSDEISKWRNLSDYRTMRYLFFCAYGVFCSAAFFHTRAYAHVGICAPAHTCATHAHLLWAREERNFSCRRFMIVLRSFFIRRAPKKQNCGISGGKQCRSLQNPVKNVKFVWKRLKNGFLRR